ncbi:hypothetical protein Droror1_Dr00005436 [Drosera rotundifolia]
MKTKSKLHLVCSLKNQVLPLHVFVPDTILSSVIWRCNVMQSPQNISGSLKAATTGKNKWKVRQKVQKVQSFIKKLVDPEKEHKLEETRKDMEDKKNKIISLIQDFDEGDKKQLLLKQFQEYEKQCSLIYKAHSDLSKQLKNKVNVHQEGSFWSDLDADSGPEDEKESPSRRIGMPNRNLIEEQNLIWQQDHADKLEINPNQRINEMIKERNDLLNDQESSRKMVEESRKSLEEIKYIDGLKNKREGLELTSTIEKHQDAEKLELIDLSTSMRDIAEEINRSMALKLYEREAEIRHAQDRVDELEAERTLLQEKLAQGKRENFSLREEHARHAAETSAQKKALEDEITNLKLKLDSLQGQKKETEEQLKKKTAEAMRLSIEVKNLEAEVQNLEMKENQLSASVKKLEETEKESLSRMQSLMVQVASLEREVEAAGAEISDLKEQILQQDSQKSDLEKSLKREIADVLESQKITQEEKKALAKKVAEMEREIEATNAEISKLKEYILQQDNQKSGLEIELKTLKREVANLTGSQKITQEEKKTLAKKVSEMEREVEAADAEISELMELIRQQDSQKSDLEIESLKRELTTLAESLKLAREEKKALAKKVAEMEREVEATDAEISELKEPIRHQDSQKSDLEIESPKRKLAALAESLKIAQEEKKALAEKAAEMANEIKQAQDLAAELRESGEQKKEAIRQMCMWFDYRMIMLREKYVRRR